MYSSMIGHLSSFQPPADSSGASRPAPLLPSAPQDAMTNSGSQSMGGGVAGGGAWLGFSLSAPSMDAAAAGPNVDVGGHHHHHNLQLQQHHGGLYYPPAPLASSSMAYYCGADSVSASNGGYYSGISTMPLKSDGSLCIMEALRRSEQEHHGVVVSASSPKLEDFLGAGPGMALSLDSSSYYYGSHGQHGHGLDHGAGGGPHQLQYALMPLGAGGQDLYYDAHAHGHAAMVDEQAAAAAMWMAQGVGTYDPGHGEDGALVPAHGAPAHLHPLTLSMSSGSQSSCVTTQAPAATYAHGGAVSGAGTEHMALDVASKKRAGQNKQPPVHHRKSIDTFGQRTSQYRGVTRHRWTGRYEAHLWDNSCRKEGQTRKGRQVYLGGYDKEEKAARAYDLAALKYWGPAANINFPLEDYQHELEEMKSMTQQEFVAHLRRRSSGFSRGASVYRGVTRHHQHGRWQARIGRVSGNKDLYLGTFSTQEEAAEAYDVAAIKFRGINAVTNFEINRYDVEKIMASSALLPSDLVRRNKDGVGGGAESAAVVANAAAALVQACTAADWRLAPTVRTGTPCSQQPQYLLSSEPFSGLHDLVDGGNAHAGARVTSNASSLATSLANSREQSPDRGGGLASMLFPKSGSWAASPAPAQPRSAVSIAHMPLFTAWTTDA